ncbi:hypothetical protein [Nocardia crassostreae]|uniref:hypothetical protein n=1 Tax=Nocardia crassostreae TaxID=53428 RepID=UPI0009FFA9EF|nr:hypothetical protein [Nocardia crassostreae]
MNEPSVGKKRTRRRAVRSEGPPPEEQTTTPVSEIVVPVSGTAATAEERIPQPPKAPEPPVADEAPAAPVELAKKEDAAPAVAADEPATDRVAAEAPAAASDDKSSRWAWYVSAAALVLAVAVAAATVFLAVQRNKLSDEEALRADYVQAAKQAMLNITNINADTAQDDINRVLAVTSGDLNTEYSQRKDDYAAIVQKAEVRAKGEVIEAALQTSDDHSAIVLVAVKQTLTNAGAEGPQQRQFRFKVTIVRGENGFTATSMEMVV